MEISKLEIEAVMKKQHVGLLILMPGNDDCPADKLIVRKEQVVTALYGCPICLLYTIRALIEQHPDLKKIFTDALNPNFHP